VQLCKASVVHALQPHGWLAGSVSTAGFCSHFMTVKLALIWLFYDEVWFHLHGHVSTQNNWYWSLIHKGPLHDVISAYLNGIERVWPHFQHILVSWFCCFYGAVLESCQESLVALGGELRISCQEVTVAFNFVIGCTVQWLLMCLNLATLPHIQQVTNDPLW
jgi:hypothetical protein